MKKFETWKETIDEGARRAQCVIDLREERGCAYVEGYRLGKARGIEEGKEQVWGCAIWWLLIGALIGFFLGLGYYQLLVK